MKNSDKFYPMNSAELLDTVLDVYKKSFGKQLALSIIFRIILTVVLFIFLFTGAITMVIAFAISAEAGENRFFLISMAIIGVLAIFTILVFHSALTQTGNSLITKHTFLDEPIDIESAIKASFRKILPAATAGLANLIILIPAFLLVAVFLAIYIKIIMNFESGENTPEAIVIIGLLVLLIIIFVVTVLCLSLTMMSMSVAVFEKKYFFAAVKKGFQLTKPDFAKILGLVTVWNLITMASSYSLTGLFDIASLAGAILPQESAGMISIFSTGISSALSTVIGLLLAPLSGIFSTLMYINQRFKHEGLDIELNLLLEQARQRNRQILSYNISREKL